jgi:NTE family protein
MAGDAAAAPVTDERPERLDAGSALCLSGGGYRAMLYHVGALWRLNELGHLHRLARFSSVSGGSITAATLALHWGELAFNRGGVASDASLNAAVVAPIRAMAGRTIDEGSVLGGLLTPGRSIADKIAAAYREHLFGDATLQDLPDAPRFVINATNLRTGALWRFSKRYMADWTIGRQPAPTVRLATAVAASSAFPPFLSPLRLAVDPDAWERDPGRPGDNFGEPFVSGAVLSDGGVYDNLGLEAVWKRCPVVLVSDGGGKMQPRADVPGDWAQQSYRVNQVIDNQVRSLRKRATIAGFVRKDREGTYWGIRSDVARYGPPAGSLPAPVEKTIVLADVDTRLEALDGRLQERLINWGYAACDVAMRRWVQTDAPAPDGFPYPDAGVG